MEELAQLSIVVTNIVAEHFWPNAHDFLQILHVTQVVGNSPGTEKPFPLLEAMYIQQSGASFAGVIEGEENSLDCFRGAEPVPSGGFPCLRERGLCQGLLHIGFATGVYNMSAFPVHGMAKQFGDQDISPCARSVVAILQQACRQF